MEIKKTPKADLENKKFMFREIGLVVALLLVFCAFEWTTKENTIEELETKATINEIEEIIPITQDQNQPPPPPAPKEPIISDEIEIVDDDIKIDETLIISEDDKDLGVTIGEYNAGVGQGEEEVVEEDVPFAIIEDKPKFNGGDAVKEFSKWVGKQIGENYPEEAKENGIQGRVIVQFTIDKEGHLRNAKVLRGVDSSLDKFALEIVKSSPKWTPGKQRGKPTNVTFQFPIVFQLR